MLSFKITFHRYSDGDSLFSSPEFVLADNFAQAHVMAQHILTGLRAADTKSQFIIASIETHGLHGKESNGIGMFGVD